MPKTIVYNVNPADNFTVAMLGNFQRDCPAKCNSVRKVALGSRDGMAEQMKTLANAGLLSRFVGMLTDSRSFLSFPRHEYQKNSAISGLMDERGIVLIFELIRDLAKRICFDNAKD